MGAPPVACPASSAAPAGSDASAWIWAFSSTHSTTARSGGFLVRPARRRRPSPRQRSFDSLNSVLDIGFEVELPSSPPDGRPLQARLHSAIEGAATSGSTSFGISSKVATTTSSTSSSRIDDGAGPWLPLVEQAVQPRSDEPEPPAVPAAVTLTPDPAATCCSRSHRARQHDPRTHRQDCTVFARRAHRRSSARSTSSTSGRPSAARPVPRPPGRPTRSGGDGPPLARRRHTDREPVAPQQRIRQAVRARQDHPRTLGHRRDPSATARSNARRSAPDNTISTAQGPGCDITTPSQLTHAISDA